MAAALAIRAKIRISAPDRLTRSYGWWLNGGSGPAKVRHGSKSFPASRVSALDRMRQNAFLAALVKEGH